ncbi:MAG TPA: ribosome biogenesis GTPase Der [Candidatus Coproplasma stercorigallinarum]|nr:ribosome biogenesis GTPase Der [Candidatus Coproplasma stercorigallinarum]
MSKPLVAIVGRPNVGKSTFFNKVAGRKISITEDRPGVTRDRLYADAEWRGRAFSMVDTGGIELKSQDTMWREIKKQAEVAIDTAHVILFFVDGKEGLTASDYDVADMLRRSKKPVILVVNKIDDYSEDKLFEFYSLGLGEPYAVSSEHGTGLGDLLDEVVSYFEKIPAEDDNSIKIAVVGKPNAGKSSLVNRLLGFDRSIVTDIAGTTRDAIDTRFTAPDGGEYTIIDTAGIRKKSRVEDDIEYYSVMRAFDAVRRADVCILVVDSTEGLTEQDTKIIGYVHEQGKPSVVVMNKWDLIEKDTNTINEFQAKLKEDLKFMDYFRSLYVSAKTGQRTDKILAAVKEVYANSKRRIQTGVLNDVISSAVRANEPPSYNGRRLKIYYSTQVAEAPPVFAIFVNDGRLLHFSYERFLENTLRSAFDFSGTPIKIVTRDKKEDN